MQNEEKIAQFRYACIVFIPNALVMASRIMNYSDLPNRRVEINLAIDNNSELEESMALVTRLMDASPGGVAVA